jgi:hypothetical protein
MLVHQPIFYHLINVLHHVPFHYILRYQGYVRIASVLLVQTMLIIVQPAKLPNLICITTTATVAVHQGYILTHLKCA